MQMPHVAPVILPEMYKIFIQAEVCSVDGCLCDVSSVWLIDTVTMMESFYLVIWSTFWSFQLLTKVQLFL